MWTRKKELIGQAVPYGIYDVSANRGDVCVGDCFDIPRFAVDAIGDWWCDEGCGRYRRTRRLLILADGGGIQQLSLAGMEGAIAGAVVRSLWLGRHGVPLPDGLLEMESDRASAVQSHQPELVRGAAALV
ncbi:MAG TPA: hypothetical protein VM571_02115 [Noviherbaspirillum sp.]|jgi:hypothetical protein|nr:hypothetical protein [Noviherbaspirillum sp.]